MNNYQSESIRRLTPLDRVLAVVTRGLADATTTPAPARPYPVPRGVPAAADEGLDEAARRHAGGLMRVNHVGEVCAQALYEGHALTVRDDRLSSFFLAAADEERDHLGRGLRRLVGSLIRKECKGDTVPELGSEVHQTLLLNGILIPTAGIEPLCPGRGIIHPVLSRSARDPLMENLTHSS